MDTKKSKISKLKNFVVKIGESIFEGVKSIDIFGGNFTNFNDINSVNYKSETNYKRRSVKIDGNYVKKDILIDDKISIEGNVENLYVESGDVIIKGSDRKCSSVSTNQGDINLYNSKVEGDVGSNQGDIKIEGDVVGNVSSTQGDIVIKGNMSKGDIDTVQGDITISSKS